MNPFENTLRKLRMNTMYGGGMPDLDRLEELAFALRNEEEMRGGRLRMEQESRQGRQMREKFKYDEMANVNEHNRRVDSAPRLPQIAQSIVKPEVKPPMNVVFKDSISPYQQAQIAARDKDRESRNAIAEGKLEQGDTKIASAAEKDKNSANDRERRTKILEDKAGKDTLNDKEQIELNALNAAKRAEVTQKGLNTRQEDSQAFTEGRDKTTQESALARIAATALNTDRQIGLRGDETRTTNAASAADKRDNPESSFQQKTAIQIRMNRFVRENPEYQGKITLDDDGYPDLSKVEDPDERERINLALGNRRTRDIKLPGGSSSRPDPMGIRQ